MRKLVYTKHCIARSIPYISSLFLIINHTFMRFYHLLAVVGLLFLAGCDKDEPNPVTPPEEIIKEEIGESLAAEPDLSEFREVFKEVEIEAEVMETGITVFAPANADPGGRLKQDADLTPEVLKGHIVKGILNANNLSDGDTLIALNGNLLHVTIDGEEVRINGVLVSGKNLAAGDKYIVHKVEEIIKPGPEEPEPPAPESGSITITVRNSVKWSVANPDNLAEAGVVVDFYAEREDYPNGEHVYRGETNDLGQVTFADAEAGKTYYIVAYKDEISSNFYVVEQPDGSLAGFIPDGIFQSQEEIDNAASQQDAAIGNLRWRDLNGDGIITGDDRTALPYLEATATAEGTEVDVLVGYDNNDAMFVRDGDDALKTLREARVRLDSFHKNLVMLDGILSDDAACGADINSCIIDNFTFDASHSAFVSIWTSAYDAVAKLNLILRDASNFEGYPFEQLILAEARGMRAYLYLQLTTYFGDIPYITEGAIDIGASRMARAEVLGAISDELSSIVGDLSATSEHPDLTLTQGAAYMLLAKAALVGGNLNDIVNYSDLVTSNAYYSLVTPEDIFADATNSEIIWDFSQNLTPAFKDYFENRPFCPALRLAEAYLMNAEGNLLLNNLDLARNSLDIVRARRGMAPSSGTTMEELRAELHETWRVEMLKEGTRYASVLRWNEIPESMLNNGYNDLKHTLLPVPQLFIDQYLTLSQNPGY